MAELASPISSLPFNIAPEPLLSLVSRLFSKETGRERRVSLVGHGEKRRETDSVPNREWELSSFFFARANRVCVCVCVCVCVYRHG
jgi:hypothetical protein